MQPATHHTSCVSRFERVLAWLLAGLVFALGLLAASPAAHALLHDHPTATHDHADASHDDDAGCVITLFQHGITVPLDLPRLDTPPARQVERILLPSSAAIPAKPRHLLQPARGPPDEHGVFTA